MIIFELWYIIENEDFCNGGGGSSGDDDDDDYDYNSGSKMKI